MTHLQAAGCLGLDLADIAAIIESGALPADPNALTIDTITLWLNSLPLEPPEQRRLRAKSDGSDTTDIFWKRVSNVGGEGCWLWTGATRYYGYGVMHYRGKPRSAHRIAWELTHGKVLNRRSVIMHTCDQPACCRPDHLVRGNQRTNQADMARKGRSAHGERNARAVLTEAIVREARRRKAAGESTRAIAEALGVGFNTLRVAISGRSWTHLE
jgi:hypothetical protein